MRKIIERTKKHSFTVAVVVVLTLGVVSAILSLNAGIAVAVEERVVGGVSGAVVPFATGGEYLTFSYSGPGVLDLDGWTVTSNTGSTYIVRDLSVASGETKRACEVEDNNKCDVVWPSGPMFDNVSGVVTVRDADHSFVYDIAYNDLDSVNDAGSSFRGNGVYVTSVYGKPDKITLCHLNGKGVYITKQNTAGSFMNSYLREGKGHHADPEDIIAPFFYASDSSAKVEYFPGLNRGLETRIASDCS